MNILKVYNYFDNIENVKSSQNRYVQYLFPFFQNSFLDHSEAKDKRIAPDCSHRESNTKFHSSHQRSTGKKVLPNNCANNNCLFE